MTPAPMTREAVEARASAIRNSSAGWRPDANLLLALLARAEAAERERGYGDTLIADHLDTIRRRDEKIATLTAERDQLTRDLAEWQNSHETIAAERDRLAGELAEAKRMHQNAAANGYDISQKLALVTLERDEWKGSALSLGAKWDELDDTARALTADLAAARAELARWQEDHESQTARAMCAEEQERILSYDLAAARETIDGMREALEPFGSAASMVENDRDDRTVSIGRWHDPDCPRFIADIRVSVADIRRAAALAKRAYGIVAHETVPHFKGVPILLEPVLPGPDSDELEDARDTIDGLTSELDSAIDVLWRRGDDEARKWIALNYPNFTPVKRALPTDGE